MNSLVVKRGLIKACVKAFDAWNGARRSPPAPASLFHFTDCAGLCGILETRTLWASMAMAMNDSSEVLYGTRLAQDLIEAMPTRTTLLGFTQEVLRNPGTKLEVVQHFVVSLCEKTDKSVHWLHYGRSGSGVALGFDTQELIQRLPIDYKLVNVSYSKDEQRGLVQELIDKVCSAVESFAAKHHPERELIEQAGARLLAGFVLALAPQFKDPCFVEEDEWRIVLTRRQPKPESTYMNFRAMNGRVIPYLKLPLTTPEHPLLPIQSIELGQSSPMRQSDPGLEVLVRSVNPNATITTSSVPLR